MRYPTINDVAECVKRYADALVSYLPDADAESPDDGGDDDESGWGDIRLQVTDDGAWELHTGDPQYDTDHRGYWGATSVDAGASMSKCREVARELIEQVKDNYAQVNC